jgi:hypothetical protein
MAQQVRASDVEATDDTIMPMLSRGKTANARMWVYVGDDAHAYNVFHSTLDRGRDRSKYFLRSTGRLCWQMITADITAWRRVRRLGESDAGAHAIRKIIEAEKAASRDCTGDHRDDSCAVHNREAGTALSTRGGWTCVKNNLRLCWFNCGRSFLAGRSCCCPSIPWLRQSATRWVNGRS